MLYDRPYMQDSYSRREQSILLGLIIATVAVFLIQNIAVAWFKSGIIINLFALSGPAVEKGMLWTFFTYGFLHGNVLHILVNLLLVYFIGRELVILLGNQRFLGVYLAAICVGGLFWYVIQLATGRSHDLVGASAAAFGLLAVFACFFPNRQITVLLFFIIPVTVKPKYLAFGLLGFSAVGLLIWEIPGVGNIAHSAHLGGMLTGWLYYRYAHAAPGARPAGGGVRVEMPSWLVRKKKSASPPPAYKVNVTSRKDLRAEVDRILDKINSQGFGALTPEEKKLLDEARDLLSRR
ncbi:MAG: rhomboid family intramembrane serine protease [Puniceicoccaceae bacterium]|nr:MAG: rhomboid family intramembrane serine protease [Puniceicoccaceae bacterium]